MRKYFVLILLSLSLHDSFAQKTIDGLINAEKSFAAYSVAHGTKDAFLKFADSAAIVFEQGKPVNAVESWNKREKRPGVLDWYPQFAGIAMSGNLGYTSGPWTFSLNDSIVARGQYSTIWHIDKYGEWKFLLDLGVNNTPENTDTSKWWRVMSTDPTLYIGSLQSLLKTEKKFIKKTGNKKDDRKRLYFNNTSKTLLPVLIRNGRVPAMDYDQFLSVMNTMPSKIKYTINGSGISLSKDLGYVYGTTIINGKSDSYLRIWRKEKEGWMIILEVLRY